MTKGNVSKVVLAVASALVAFSVTACNTTEGLGKDTQAAGRGIEKAADNNK